MKGRKQNRIDQLKLGRSSNPFRICYLEFVIWDLVFKHTGLFKTVFVVLVIGLISCSAKKVNEEAAKRSKHEITIGGVRLAARVLPAQAQQDAVKTKSKELLWFNVNIEKANAELEKEKMLYINFDMQQDFTLMANGDSLASVFCQRIENGKTASYEYAVAFEQPSSHLHDTYTLFYKDKLFGIGTVAFVYNQNDFTK